MVEMKAKKVNIDELKFDEKGLIAAIAQDYESGEVLMQAFMNREAVEKTFETGYAHYYSRSRASLWKKGETSGNTQKVLTAYLDCDKDCILLKVRQKGVACHTGTYSCFSQQVKGDENEIGAEMFGKLQRIVEDRKKNPEEGSYTSFLFARGIDKIAKKAGEEAVELVIASKNDDKGEVIGEAADFLYHMMVLLAEKGVKLSEVCSELYKRNKERSLRKAAPLQILSPHFLGKRKRIAVCSAGVSEDRFPSFRGWKTGRVPPYSRILIGKEKSPARPQMRSGRALI